MRSDLFQVSIKLIYLQREKVKLKKVSNGRKYLMNNTILILEKETKALNK